MEKGGQLSIRVAVSGDRADISIEDEGCGIPEAHMDKILECFFTTKSYGSGLGLCISKKYIDEHDGSDLFIESDEGKGTTIKINLTASKLPEMRSRSLWNLKVDSVAWEDLPAAAALWADLLPVVLEGPVVVDLVDPEKLSPRE